MSVFWTNVCMRLMHGVGVWGGISENFRTPLVILYGCITARRYTDEFCVLLCILLCHHILMRLFCSKIMLGHM